MSEAHITRYTLGNRGVGKTDWARLKRMTEEEIEAGAASDPDNGPWTEEQLAGARLVMPEARTKVPVSLRMDAEVLDYFKAQGPRYQTRINAVLRAYVRSSRRRSARASEPRP